MGQHLYQCERPGCGKWGVAHYVLINGVNVLMCTGCWEKWKAEGNVESGPGEEVSVEVAS